MTWYLWNGIFITVRLVGSWSTWIVTLHACQVLPIVLSEYATGAEGIDPALQFADCKPLLLRLET